MVLIYCNCPFHLMSLFLCLSCIVQEEPVSQRIVLSSSICFGILSTRPLLLHYFWLITDSVQIKHQWGTPREKQLFFLLTHLDIFCWSAKEIHWSEELLYIFCPRNFIQKAFVNPKFKLSLNLEPLGWGVSYSYHSAMFA